MQGEVEPSPVETSVGNTHKAFAASVSPRNPEVVRPVEPLLEPSSEKDERSDLAADTYGQGPLAEKDRLSPESVAEHAPTRPDVGSGAKAPVGRTAPTSPTFPISRGAPASRLPARNERRQRLNHGLVGQSTRSDALQSRQREYVHDVRLESGVSAAPGALDPDILARDIESEILDAPPQTNKGDLE